MIILDLKICLNFLFVELAFRLENRKILILSSEFIFQYFWFKTNLKQ